MHAPEHAPSQQHAQRSAPHARTCFDLPLRCQHCCTDLWVFVRRRRRRDVDADAAGRVALDGLDGVHVPSAAAPRVRPLRGVGIGCCVHRLPRTASCSSSGTVVPHRCAAACADVAHGASVCGREQLMCRVAAGEDSGVCAPARWAGTFVRRFGVSPLRPTSLRKLIAVRAGCSCWPGLSLRRLRWAGGSRPGGRRVLAIALNGTVAQLPHAGAGCRMLVRAAPHAAAPRATCGRSSRQGGGSSLTAAAAAEVRDSVVQLSVGAGSTSSPPAVCGNRECGRRQQCIHMAVAHRHCCV